MFVLNTNLIREKMTDNNFTGTTMADKLNMTSGNFSMLINNKGQSINLEHAYQICTILNIRINDLIVQENDEQTPQDLLNEIYYLTDKLSRATKLHQELSRQTLKPATTIFNKYTDKAQTKISDHFPMKQSEAELTFARKLKLKVSINEKVSKLAVLANEPLEIYHIIYSLQCFLENNPVEINHSYNNVIHELLKELKKEIDIYFANDPIKHKESFIDSIIQNLEKQIQK